MLKMRSGVSRGKRQWFQTAVQLRGSVVVAVIPRVIVCTAFGFLISILYYSEFPVSWPILSGIVPSIVLGLLLVFRTNTAYDRFWEGRKSWGSILNNGRNLASQIWVAVEVESSEDRTAKEAVLRLIVAFAVATKLHLRSELVTSELEALMPAEKYYHLKSVNHPPLEIVFWIRDYLQQQQERNCLNMSHLAGMFRLLDGMVDSVGACERILKTPLPLAYTIHLKQLLLIYCLSLPFQMVKDLQWGTGFVVGLVSFAVFGIEEIGIEIENPFGRDPNDLPLDTICASLQRNIEDLIALPSSAGD